MTRNETFLKAVLRANAVFSLGSAGIAAAAAAPLAGMLAVPASEMTRLGVNLAVFAAFLAYLATGDRLRRAWALRAVLAVAAADAIWVAGSVAGLALALGDATAAGRVLVGAVAVVVGAFGALEIVGWSRVRRERIPVTARRPA